MKKLALGLGIVALAIFSFLYIQLYRVQNSIDKTTSTTKYYGSISQSISISTRTFSRESSV